MTAYRARKSPNKLTTCAYQTRRITLTPSIWRTVIGAAWNVWVIALAEEIRTSGQRPTHHCTWSTWTGLVHGPRRAQRACEGAAWGVGAPQTTEPGSGAEPRSRPL